MSFFAKPVPTFAGHALTGATAVSEVVEELLFFQLPQFFFPFLPSLLVREPAKAQPAFAVADETQRSAAVSASFVHRPHSRSRSHWRTGARRRKLCSPRPSVLQIRAGTACRERRCKSRASF